MAVYVLFLTQQLNPGIHWYREARLLVFFASVGGSVAESWEFEEAIECFKTINSCLKCIYRGEIHMHRVLAVQLRILLCDNTSKPLLVRLFPGVRIPRLSEPVTSLPGEFPAELSYLNTVRVDSPYPHLVTCMPFEADIYFNGVEDCRPIRAQSNDYLPVAEWIEQIVTLHPQMISVREVIRKVADRGGGAHVHKTKDDLLFALREAGPTKMSQAALILVAVAKCFQHTGQAIVQMYERAAGAIAGRGF